ncbi:MAG: hypothetical protein U1F68_18170 [Gammaproteobacteria bacterium]
MDTSRSIPISARIPSEDAAFLARLQIEGAITPSDKLRAIITQARRQHEGQHDYASSLQWIREALAPALDHVRDAEHRARQHSDLVLRLGEWLPQAVALIHSFRQSPAGDPEALRDLEQALADRVFQLLEAILRLGITGRAPCYDKQVIADRLDPILELSELISSTTTKE